MKFGMDLFHKMQEAKLFNEVERIEPNGKAHKYRAVAVSRDDDMGNEVYLVEYRRGFGWKSGQSAEDYLMISKGQFKDEDGVCVGHLIIPILALPKVLMAIDDVVKMAQEAR